MNHSLEYPLIHWRILMRQSLVNGCKDIKKNIAVHFPTVGDGDIDDADIDDDGNDL